MKKTFVLLAAISTIFLSSCLPEAKVKFQDGQTSIIDNSYLKFYEVGDTVYLEKMNLDWEIDNDPRLPNYEKGYLWIEGFYNKDSTYYSDIVILYKKAVIVEKY